MRKDGLFLLTAFLALALEMAVAAALHAAGKIS